MPRERLAGFPWASTPHGAADGRWTQGAGLDAFDPPPATLTNYACKGFVDKFAASFMAGGLVEAGDVKVIIVAKTLAIEPRLTDSVTVRGKTYSIINISADPARALWEL